MNQVVNRFANQPIIEWKSTTWNQTRGSQSHLTLQSNETILLPHFSWLLHPSQTIMPYPSMTSLLPNFSWLLHPSQMNVQKGRHCIQSFSFHRFEWCPTQSDYFACVTKRHLRKMEPVLAVFRSVVLCSVAGKRSRSDKLWWYLSLIYKDIGLKLRLWLV